MSRTQIKIRASDMTPVTGGVKTPARLLRVAVDSNADAPASVLDRHLLRLLTLHDLPDRFKNVNLPKMNDAAKRSLLADIQELLKIDHTRFPEMRGAGSGAPKDGSIGDHASADPELSAVMKAWPGLPSVVKTGIVAMVKATSDSSTPR